MDVKRELPSNLTMASVQDAVLYWYKETFGEQDPRWMDIEERCLRFFEEGTELVQALGLSKEQALAMVEYVFARPVGDPFQELGGTIITLAALANSANLSMGPAFRTENNRCWDAQAKIREKQMSKPLRGKNQPDANSK